MHHTSAVDPVYPDADIPHRQQNIQQLEMRGKAGV